MKHEAPNNHPIFAACLSGDAKAVREHLSSGIHPFANGVISAAIRGGHVEVMNVFLEEGIDMNYPGDNFAVGLIPRIIETKQMPILKLFIEKGADVLSDPRGYGTPLHGAAAHWPQAIPVLLEAGADVHAATKDGRTPMMAAAFGNQLESMDLLLTSGAKLEDRDNEGTTPLILAARAGKAEAIEWLLDHGANVLAQDERGRTAEDWAEENGHPKIAELLQSRKGS